jgi:hypothetical protein
MHLLRHPLKPLLLLLRLPPIPNPLNSAIPLYRFLGFHLTFEEFGGAGAFEEGYAGGVASLARGGSKGGFGGMPYFSYERGC